MSDKASGQYNIITANIVANAILSLAPAVPGLMADGATFIASGIIDTRKDEVIAGLEQAATQENASILAARPKHHILGPAEEGVLACGVRGAGKLVPVDDIILKIQDLLS